MTLNALIEKLRGVIRQGTRKSEQMLGEFNLLIQLLPIAGFEVVQVEVVLTILPTATIQVKGKAINQEKLEAILRENQDKRLVSAVLGYLSQANRLSNSVDTVELKEVKINLSYKPSVTMHWAEKAEQAAAIAA